MSEWLGVNLRIDLYLYWWKPHIQFISWSLEWSLAIGMLYLHLSSHMASESTQRPTSSAWRYVALNWEGGCWKTMSNNRTLHYATQLRECSLGCEKILNIWLSKSPHCNILNIMCGIWLSKRQKALCNIKDKMKARFARNSKVV